MRGVATGPDMRLRHGDNRRGARSPEYNTWVGMRRRCNDVADRNYQNYGARGIAVCKRWAVFANFLSDMGRRPSPGHSIERINNDGNYEPNNCTWATRIVQSRNRRPRKLRDLCKKGHPLTDENSYQRPNSRKRRCRICRAQNMADYYARKRAA